ncbi:MAG: tetratricopeptide repeat protein [Candidatus Aenigmatarchaeota archaeon]
MTDERQDYYVVKIEQALSKKDIEKAMDYLKVVNTIGNSYNNPLIKYEQAKVLYFQKNFDDAEKVTIQLLKDHQTNPLFHELYGLILLAKGNFEEAKREFEIFDDIFDNSRSKFLLGLVNLLLNDEKEALANFKLSYEYDKFMFSKLVLNLQVELFSDKEILPKLSIILNKLME